MPTISEAPTSSLEELAAGDRIDANHPSFDLGGDTGAAHAELKSLLDAGFAELFVSRSAAEAHLGAPVLPSPLGDVVKVKEDGTEKHRMIQDLRASGINSTSAVSERQVLPRFTDHALDLARASASSEHVCTLVLDFSHAFMTVPLHAKERPHAASVVPSGITRSRSRVYAGEPLSGTILVWRVLGFGGHSNPLVYSRIATFAIRSAQALLTADPSLQLGTCYCQLYVDDPAVVIEGSLQERARTLDLLLTWWQVLGIPLAWPKGSVTLGQHTWIGVDFAILSPGACRMTLPVAFLQDLANMVQHFVRQRGHVSAKLADKLVGKPAG